MKNYVQSGDYLTIAAPGPVASGDVVVRGSLVGVAVAAAAAANDPVTVCLVGVYNLPKASAQAWTAGAKIYWDGANKRATTTATGNVLIGVAVADAGASDSNGKVRLNGAFV